MNIKKHKTTNIKQNKKIIKQHKTKPKTTNKQTKHKNKTKTTNIKQPPQNKTKQNKET